MSPDYAHDEIDEQTLRLLTQLADGSLEGWERAELEVRVDYSPTLRAALARQRAGAAALRGIQLQAPAELRARVAEIRASARRPRRPRWTVAAPIAAAAAAAALFALVVLPSDSSHPTVPEVASLYRPADELVGVDSSNPKLLDAQVEGVPFPNWSREFGWRQNGTRTDELDGRTARTVFYEMGAKRVAYTIVSGKGIPAPEGSRATTRNGVHLHVLAQDGRWVVTWWRDGRTCVLSGSPRDVSDRELVKLASWKGDGAVPF